MRVGRTRVGRDLDRAPAFGGEEELVPAVAYEGADQLLAAAVVGRGVDQVDAAVEDRVQQAARILIRNLGTARPASQLHGAVAENGHIRASAPEGPCHDRHVSNAIPEDPWSGAAKPR